MNFVFCDKRNVDKFYYEVIEKCNNFESIDVDNTSITDYADLYYLELLLFPYDDKNITDAQYNNECLELLEYIEDVLKIVIEKKFFTIFNDRFCIVFTIIYDDEVEDWECNVKREWCI